MTRLIDADKAIEATWEQPTYTDPLNVLTEVRERIRELPTVEAMPIRHGKWLKREEGCVYPFWERYTCSECGKHSDSTNFCPNCGARMDEEE